MYRYDVLTKNYPISKTKNFGEKRKELIIKSVENDIYVN